MLPPSLQDSLPAGWLAFAGRASTLWIAAKGFRSSILLFWTWPGAREVSWRSCALPARQTHREHRSLARFARHGHIAAHHARELAGDGKAEPRAAEALRGRGLGLAECLEQLRLLLRRHAHAGIDHRKLDPVASVNHPSRSQLDLTLFGELAGIAQQVEQYLPQPHGVHGEDTQVLLNVDNETVLVLLGKLSGGADDLVDQRC